MLTQAIKLNRRVNWGLGRGLQGRGRGFDMGSITVPDRSLQRQKKPSVPLVFCKLRPSFSLSRQRSRVRAPSSPPHIPKELRNVWTYSDIEIWVRYGCSKSSTAHFESVFSSLISPRFGT